MKLIARLDHRNIVRAHDAREEKGGVHYLVMEYVDGVNLHELVGHLGPLPIPAACEIIRQVALGLHHAYEHGLVHRDMKPSNMMLSRTGEVKMLDLGLARLSAEHQHTRQLTEAGFAMGTVDYMAPEQWEDSSGVDIRADIYSLGCTLFYILTGSAPYSGPQYTSARKKLMAHAAAPVPSARVRRSDIPADLDAVLECVMAKEPEDRPQTPIELAEELERWADPNALADMLHDAFEGEASVYTAQLRSSSSEEGTPRGRSSSRGGTATRKSSRWMRTTHRRRAADMPWYREPRIVLPLAAVCLGIIGILVVMFGIDGPANSLKPKVQDRLVKDVVLAPGPYGDWWFEESPWLMPSVRANLLTAIDLGQETVGEESLLTLEKLCRGSDADTYEEGLRKIARALVPTGGNMTPTEELLNFLLSDEAVDQPQDDFNKKLDQLSIELSRIESPTAVDLHERAVLMHYRGEYGLADALYQQALEAYSQAEPPLNSLAILCQADRAMLAFHTPDYATAIARFEALRGEDIGPAMELHARCFEIDAQRKLGEYSDALAAFEAAKASAEREQEYQLGSKHPLQAYLLEREAWLELDWGHLSAAVDRFEAANRIRLHGGSVDPLNEGSWGPWAFNRQGQAMAMHFLGDHGTRAAFQEIVDKLIDRSTPGNSQALPGWEERLQVRERLPNTLERQADEYLYGSAGDGSLPDYGSAQKALEESLSYASDLQFDDTRKWPHMNRVQYKLALAIALQIDEDHPSYAVRAQRLIEAGDRLVEEKTGDEPLPESVVDLYANDRQLAIAVLALQTGDATEQLAARQELLSMVRAADAEKVNRSNVEPLLMAIEQLALTADLASEDWTAQRAELAARLTAITGDLLQSEEDSRAEVQAALPAAAIAGPSRRPWLLLLPRARSPLRRRPPISPLIGCCRRPAPAGEAGTEAE